MILFGLGEVELPRAMVFSAQYHRPVKIHCKIYIPRWYFLDSGKEDSRRGYSLSPNIIAPPESIVNFTFPDDTFQIRGKRTRGEVTLHPQYHRPVKIYCKFYISRWYFLDSRRWNCPGRGYSPPMYHRPARIYCKFYISRWYFSDSGRWNCLGRWYSLPNIIAPSKSIVNFTFPDDTFRTRGGGIASGDGILCPISSPRQNPL